jgi:hypothetical protein
MANPQGKEPKPKTGKWTTWKPFRATTVRHAPDYRGVYMIRLAQGSYAYPGGESKLVYVGEAHAEDSSIKKRLSAHLSGSGDPGVDALLQRDVPLRVCWKKFGDPKAAETELLVAFDRKFGARPCANGRIEWGSLVQPREQKKKAKKKAGRR